MMEVVLIATVVLIVFMIAVFFGFWMGRQTVEKPIEILKPSKAGGQPVFEEDPYRDAMKNEKSEGSL
jgi:hypothetical protein